MTAFRRGNPVAWSRGHRSLLQVNQQASALSQAYTQGLRCAVAATPSFGTSGVSVVGFGGHRAFASKKNDDDGSDGKTDADKFEEQRIKKKTKKVSEATEDTEGVKATGKRGKSPKAKGKEEVVEGGEEQAEAAPKKKRRSKADIEEQKAQDAKVKADQYKEQKKTTKRSSKTPVDSSEPQRMYTLKFNSPILPYAKFPLTQNKYIQDFLRGYDEDRDQI